jgi:hypothetical protein
MVAKAECTWGMGPDVLVVVEGGRDYGVVGHGDGKISFGQRAREARVLAAQLLAAADRADALQDGRAGIFDRCVEAIEIATDHGVISIEPRPGHCDRGRVLVRVEPRHARNCSACDVNDADGFPRYFFSLDRALAEVSDWMAARNWKPGAAR